MPRKGVTELQRLLESGDREIELEVGRSHVRVKRDDVTFTSKLIDGRFPDYEAVIPIGADREVKVDREALRARCSVPRSCRTRSTAASEWKSRRAT